MQDTDFVGIKGELLRELHYPHSNNSLIINRTITHIFLFQREVQRSFTHSDFSIILFALSMATVSNDAR